MQRASEVVLLCFLSTGALALGLALCFPFFSFLPLYWGVGVALVFLACFAVCLALRKRTTAAVYLVTGFAYSAIFALAVATFTGVEREMAFDMVWSYGEKSQSYQDADHIVLRFKSHPNHYVGIYSKDLGK